MGMTKGHGTAAVVIGTLQLLVAGGLIIASFIFASYGSMSTSQTPYWSGFPVSIQTPERLIILLPASRNKLNSRHFFNLLVYDEVRNTDCVRDCSQPGYFSFCLLHAPSWSISFIV